MKRINLFLPTVALLCFVCEAREKSPQYVNAITKGAEAKFQLHVVDNKGSPVSNATVRCCMSLLGADDTVVRGETDREGRLTITGKTTGSEISIQVAKDGYYAWRGSYCLADMRNRRMVLDGQWQPYGEKVTAVLRTFNHPCELAMSSKIHTIPSTNVWVGFDMDLCDWTHPHGIGKTSDFQVLLQWDGRPPWEYPELVLGMRFQDRNAGAYVEHGSKESAFPYSYEFDASHELYSTIDYFRRFDRKVGSWRRKELAEDEALILRTRCETNAAGKVVSCNYARITKLWFSAGEANGQGTVRLQYEYNSRVNDPNLENKIYSERSGVVLRRIGELNGSMK